jgi:hypothetical protein
MAIRVSKDDQITRLRELCDQKDTRIAELERELGIARDHIAKRASRSTHWDGCDSAHPDCAIVRGINKTLMVSKA